MINVGQKMITRNCTGYLPCQISFFLQNVHIHPRKIYLSLTSMDAANAELFMQQQESTGRSSQRLTVEGKQYSQDLARFLEEQREVHSECKEMLVLSGASRVHAETLFHLRMVFSCYSTPSGKTHNNNNKKPTTTKKQGNALSGDQRAFKVCIFRKTA